jgi:acyl-CoA synthetase (AMP-forming)/AMP-acid ligase II
MIIAERPLHAELDRIFELHGDRTALVDAASGCAWSYAELSARTGAAADFLLRAGAAPGRPVLSLLPNSVEALVLFLGALRAGIDVAPVSPQASARDLRHQLELVPASVCVHSAATCELVRRAAGDVVRRNLELDGTLSWLDGAAAPATPERAARLYLQTSGTTGEPKALVFDCERLWLGASAFAAHHRFLDARCRFLNLLPMSYLGGLFNLGMLPLGLGASVVISEPFSGRSLLRFWRDVERFEVDVLWLVPTIVRGLLRLAGRTAGPSQAVRERVRASFLGTAPADLALKRRFEEQFGIALLENYALSETTFVSSESLDGDPPRVEGSVGEVLPFVELRCRPPAAAEAPGEIEVRTPYGFLGYLGCDGAIAQPGDDDGWFATGDVGRLTPEGTLVYQGRTRDIIKKGGYLIALREIELLAEQLEAVEEASAVPVAHDFFGEDYVLALRLAPDAAAEATLPRVRGWLREELARYKWPDDVVVRSDFPRTASGKVRKGQLAEEIQKAKLAPSEAGSAR